MKIKVSFNRTYINSNTTANEALFFTDEIDRDIVDKILSYLIPFDNTYDLEKYFNTEVCSNCIIITTTRGMHYLHQIMDNIERITNYEQTIPVYGPNKEEKATNIKTAYFKREDKDGNVQKVVFSNHEIPRLNWYKIVDYIYAENDVATTCDGDNYVHMHTDGNAVTITTTYNFAYLQYLMENIERIANGLEPSNSSAYSNTKSEEKTMNTNKKSPIATLDRILRVDFSKLNTKGVTVTFGAEENAAYIVFGKLVKDWWLKHSENHGKKKTINFQKEGKIVKATVYVAGFDHRQYADMIHDIFDEMLKMNDLDCYLNFGDKIDPYSGEIIVDIKATIRDQIEKVDCLCFALENKIDDLLVDGHDKDEVVDAAANLHFEVATLQEMYDYVKD